MNATKKPKPARHSGLASDDDNNNNPSNRSATTTQHRHPIVKDKKETNKGKKTLWVTVFKCFYCGEHGHKLPTCGQCSQAYYCSADCQRKHWKKHKPVCGRGGPPTRNL